MLSVRGTTVLAAMPAHDWGQGYGGGWWIVFPILWILSIGFFTFGGRRMAWRRHHEAGMAGAEGVLRERYARREVDEVEYRQRLEVLRPEKPGNK